MHPKAACILLVALVLALGCLAQEQQETCTMTPQERINCGFPGVTESECKSKGCCFNSDITGFPWCFYPVAVDNPVEEECPF
ncbi:trefoil factor 1 [Ochotona princeps]|uniref:trefoil factor 1 n=1 Tax=Ochotona princeps TaxID=9978 RepID=UPI002714F21B|nr:trefoil factor 1 [Ochotona princeps]